MTSPTPAEPAPGEPTADPSTVGIDLTTEGRPAAAGATQLGHHAVSGELARGGMGVVLRGRDVDLGREVAIKVLSPKPTGNAEGLRRFVEEARIGGQLQHPGIVPVHELGRQADGTPFFTMKLVKGRDLASELSERTSPTDELHRFLSIFASVCQTMAYAHSRGVIHRDLKPQNVMVGAFSEVLVVDWGLAKLLRAVEPAPAGDEADEAHDTRTLIHQLDDSALSMPGSVKGTPSYMPPEQATGRVHDLDARSDVFALGAILCEILTGRPPYVGSSGDTLAAARRADVGDAFAGLESCGADPSLVELARCCLAPAMAARPTDARTVAEVVTGYLAAAETRALEAGVREQEERRARVLVEEEKVRTEAALADFERLADGKRLDRLLEEAAELWPAGPNQVAHLEAWQVEAEALLSGRERHEATLQALRGRALEYDEAQAAKDRASHPEAEELATVRGRLEEAREQLTRLEAGAELPPGDDAEDAPTLTSTQERISELETRAQALAATVAERRTWLFANSADQFMHDVLAELVGRLGSFADDTTLSGSVAEVRQRLEFARTVEERTVTGKDARLAWAQATAAVAAHPDYDGLVLAPQLGLLPIGPDPDTGLWEFCHVQTGEVPARDGEGHILLAEGTGIVLELIPGGTLTMGAQATDESAASFDPMACDDESPVHEVPLRPYLLAKHQLTQAQWQRFTGVNPSTFQPEESGKGLAKSLLHPVENVSWLDCDRVLGQLGLCLPTEAQWELGCRAGTRAPWWTGAEMHSLEGAGNFADSTYVKWGGNPAMASDWPELETGYNVHAPVGSFRANPWGIHDVHGNVGEWCADWFGGYERPLDDETGERRALGARQRVVRGGSWGFGPRIARSSFRGHYQPSYRDGSIGVRPARRLD